MSEHDFQTRFLLLNPLQTGTFRSVLLVQDSLLHTLSVLKIYFPASMKTAEFACADNELKALLALQGDSYITQLLDAFKLDTVICLETEYLAGGTLTDCLGRGVVPIESAFSLACQLTRAVSAVHRAGFLHLDLKVTFNQPENVFLTSDFAYLKLGDFSSATNERTWNGVGTEGKMPSEAFAKQKVEAKTDIWALGLILTEMQSSFRAEKTDPRLSQVITEVGRMCLEPESRRCSLKYVLSCLTTRKLQSPVYVQTFPFNGSDWEIDFSRAPSLLISGQNVRMALKPQPLDTQNPPPTPISETCLLGLLPSDGSLFSSPCSDCSLKTVPFHSSIDLEILFRSHNSSPQRLLLVTNLDQHSYEMIESREFWRGKIALSVGELKGFSYAFALLDREERKVSHVMRLRTDLLDVATRGIREAGGKDGFGGNPGMWKLTVSTISEGSI